MKIVTYPAKVLLQEAAPVAERGDDLRERVREMFRVMYEAKGLGLAAPQVDWPVRLFIVNESGRPDEGEELVFVNPTLLEKQGSATAEEGCLSIPGVFGLVRRAASVRIAATDLAGTPFELSARELLARVVQHEYDHLLGILFVSKVVPSQQKLVAKRLREIRLAEVPG